MNLTDKQIGAMADKIWTDGKSRVEDLHGFRYVYVWDVARLLAEQEIEIDHLTEQLKLSTAKDERMQELEALVKYQDESIKIASKLIADIKGDLGI